MKSALIGIAITTAMLAATWVPAQAAQCARGVYRAGCVGPNGAIVAGPRGVATARTYGASQIRPGTSVTGVRGNTATKALAPGCAWVNGQRVCR